MNVFIKGLFITNKKFVILIIFMSSLAYYQSFDYDLIFLDDDIIVYERFEESNVPDKIKTAFTSNYLGGHYYRPVTLSLFILDSEAGGISPFIYHLTNYLIHLLACLLLLVILKNLDYSSAVAFLASLFFALNPLHINAVGWIAGRGDLLAGLFSLCALLFFQKYLIRFHAAWLIAVSLFLLLAILSKEASLLVPFLLAAFFFVEKKDLSLSKANTYPFLMVLFVLGSYYLLRVLNPDVHIDKFSFTTFYNNFLILPETISKLFIPAGIKALSKFEVFTSLSGGIIFFILLILPLRMKGINKLRYYFGLTWFLVLMLPGMVFQTMGQDGFFYWDCRSYLPAIGLIFTISEILRVVDSNVFKRRIYLIVSLYLIIISIFTFYFLKIYSSPVQFWNSVKSDYPERFLPYIGLFNYYSHLGDNIEAEKQLLDAIEIRQNEPFIRQTLINFYQKNGELVQSLAASKSAYEETGRKKENFLEIVIAACSELRDVTEIDNLILKYSDDSRVLEVIQRLLEREINKLEQRYKNDWADVLRDKLPIKKHLNDN